MRLVAAVIVSLLAGAPALAGEIRYVVVTPETPKEFTLWTSYSASINCGRALVNGWDEKQWCEEGVAGVKPKVGMLAHGTEVEVLEGTECRDMVHVRVVAGTLKGHMGCVVARALSGIKPAQ
jgi:hypothetical protein